MAGLTKWLQITPRWAEKFVAGLAGRSFAKPEPANGDFLSWGRGSKVRASVKTNFIPIVYSVWMFTALLPHFLSAGGRRQT
jgi:hypothetical protein